MERIDSYSSALRMRGTEMQDLPDCIYLSEKGRCLHLKTEKCMGERCSFLTTRGSAETATIIWAKRLNSLPESKQLVIAKKYYNGAMPWKSERK